MYLLNIELYKHLRKKRLQKHLHTSQIYDYEYLDVRAKIVTF